MKRLVIALGFYLTFLMTYGQENIFVLVDKSKSIRQTDLMRARQLLIDILSGSSIDGSTWQYGGNYSFKQVTPGTKLMIMPLGDKETVTNYSARINTIGTSSDIANYVDLFFPTKLTDDWTFITLAKARLAEIAKKEGIDTYQLIFVSDNTSDDFGGNAGYNEYEQKLVNTYNTSTNPVIEQPGTRFVLIDNPKFSLLSQSIDVSNYTSPNGSPIPAETKALKIELTSLNGGTSHDPVPVKDNKFTVSWICRNAPENVLYKVRLTPVNQRGVKAQTNTVTGNYCNFQNINNGRWRITVSSAKDEFKASSANSVIEVKDRSSMWLLWLIIISGLLGGGYYYWKKKRDKRIKKLQSSQINKNY
jgi:LPXTG-motif cell wall-anchored protein